MTGPSDANLGSVIGTPRGRVYAAEQDVITCDDPVALTCSPLGQGFPGSGFACLIAAPGGTLCPARDPPGLVCVKSRRWTLAWGMRFCRSEMYSVPLRL
ncbi:MAG TPA: hypothetical protein VJ943_10430 [Desulfotignum sp.]|nr:hypothetical protein [Desulfotignum sp.]